MVTVDAKGLFCPEPLMMTQDALKKNPGEQVVVEVDRQLRAIISCALLAARS